MASCQKIDRNEIKSIFAELDLDNNGMLDLDEFEQAMQQIGLTTNEVDKAFSIVSGIKRRKKMDGHVSFCAKQVGVVRLVRKLVGRKL